MKVQLRNHVAALLLLAPAAATFLPTPAVAAPKRAAPAPEVHTLSVNADNGLTPGSVLQFALEGTPRSRASIALGNTNITIPLKETSAGMYRGSYTVRRADRIDPTAVISARLTSGNRTLTHNFTYPATFQALAMGGPPAPATAPAPPPQIERFAMQPVGRLEPGRELRFRLNGVPGATASFEIPGVAANIPMRETRPGHYEGTYTIRQRDDLRAFDTAIATLRSGGQVVTARLNRPFVRDNQAPTISDLTPRHGETVGAAGRTVISANFDDAGGTGVDPGSVRVTLGGRDVTSAARVTPDQFTYRSDLPPGRYTAEVSARDHAGNTATKSWTFDVGGSTSMGAAPGGPLPLHVSSPANNATVDANGNLTIQGRTAPWASVRVQVEAVTPMMGNRLGVAQSLLTQTVQADREGYFSVQVSPRGLPIPGTRYEVSLTATQGQQTSEERLVLHQRQG